MGWVCLALLAPTSALAWGGMSDYRYYLSDDLHRFDLYTWDCTIDDGTNDAYDTVGEFYVYDPADQLSYWFYDDLAQPVIDGRTYWSGVDWLGPADDLEVTQMWHHPEGDSYLRQTVFVHNPTTEELTYHLGFEGDLGSDDFTSVLASSSGDLLVDNTDTWLISWDREDRGDPFVGFVWGDGALPITNDPQIGEDGGGFFFDDTDFEWADTTVAASQTVALHMFYVQAWSEQEVYDLIQKILTSEDALLGGLTRAEADQILNFDLVDIDGDGDPSTVYGGTDCDDGEATIHPGATEQCDGIDQDCDGEIDNGVGTTYYQDLDQDGYGDEAVALQACEPPPLHVDQAGDCDDSDDDTFEGAKEICGDKEDNDCDGRVDEKCAEEASGCGCTTAAPAGAMPWIALATALLVRRRRLDRPLP